MNDIWKDLNGDATINEFESKWRQWKIADSIKWFEYVIASGYDENDIGDDSDNDYKIDNIDESDSEDDSGDTNSDDDDTGSDDDDTSGNKENDEKKDMVGNMSDSKQTAQEIDYKSIEKRLLMIEFRPKQYLPLIQKPLHFKQYGFKNKKHRKLLCKCTKKLLQKYPKNQKQKKKKKSNHQSVEGHVDDTGHVE